MREFVCKQTINKGIYICACRFFKLIYQLNIDLRALFALPLSLGNKALASVFAVLLMGEGPSMMAKESSDSQMDSKRDRIEKV